MGEAVSTDESQVARKRFGEIIRAVFEVDPETKEPYQPEIGRGELTDLFRNGLAMARAEAEQGQTLRQPEEAIYQSAVEALKERNGDRNAIFEAFSLVCKEADIRYIAQFGSKARVIIKGREARGQAVMGEIDEGFLGAAEILERLEDLRLKEGEEDQALSEWRAASRERKEEVSSIVSDQVDLWVKPSS